MSIGALKSIVVAIGDPNQRPRYVLRKATEIARRTGAHLTLLHVFALPYPLNEGSNTSSAEVIERTKARFHQQLVKLAKPIQRAGIRVNCAVTWDFPIYEGLIRFAYRAKPDLLIAEAHHHNPVARWFLSNTDWELIRNCPCPLWFVKKGALSKKPKILAAVDPFHSRAKPAQLDERLIAAAKRIAHGLGGAAAAVHACNVPPDMIVAGGLQAVVVPAAPEKIRAREREARKALANLASRFGLRATRQFIVTDSPERAIPAFSRAHGADVVVMGAVSRRGLQRAILGNTAERIIDSIRTDLLILKPRGFRSRVPRRAPTA